MCRCAFENGGPLSTCLLFLGPAHRLHDCDWCAGRDSLFWWALPVLGSGFGLGTWKWKLEMSKLIPRILGWYALCCFVRLTLVGVLSLYFYLWVWAVSRGFLLSFGDYFSYLDYVFVFRENIFLLLITLSWQHSFGPFTSVCHTFFCSGISGEFLIIYCLVYTFTFYVTSHFPNEPYLGHNILINRIILLQCVTLFQAEISQTPFILCEVTNTSGIPFISNGGVHFTPLDGDGAGYHGTATS